jgi:hypothetical protein
MKTSKLILLVLATSISAFFYGCSKDSNVDTSISIKSAEKTLSAGDTYQVEAVSTAAITYASENDFHAIVSSSGLVTARFVGETNIVLSTDSDNKKVKIAVKPKYTLYPDPCLAFGISKNEIIAKYGTPSTQTTSGISYTNYSNAAPLVMYVFDTNNKLAGSAVAVKSEYSSELGSFLIERYMLADKTNRIFINSLDPKKATMLIGATLNNTTHWLVSYYPYTSKSNATVLKSSIKYDLFNELINKKR